MSCCCCCCWRSSCTRNSKQAPDLDLFGSSPPQLVYLALSLFLCLFPHCRLSAIVCVCCVCASSSTHKGRALARCSLFVACFICTQTRANTLIDPCPLDQLKSDQSSTSSSSQLTASPQVAVLVCFYLSLAMAQISRCKCRAH